MKKLIKKGDVLIIGIILLVSLVIFLCVKFIPSSGNMVEIKVDGETIVTESLENDFDYNVTKDEKVVNTVEVKDGYVSVTYATCKDKICVNHKRINKEGESIICLPNGVTVSIVNNDSDIDGVAR